MPANFPVPRIDGQPRGGAAVGADCIKRARKLRIFAGVYVVLSFGLLTVAIIAIYHSRDYAIESIKESLSAAQVRVVAPRHAGLRDVAINRHTGQVMAVGRRGLVQVSDEYAERWRGLDVYTGKTLNGIALSEDGEIAIVVGMDGLIRFSRDGGDTWTGPSPGNVTPKNIYGVALSADGEVAVAVGEDGLTLISKDQGKRWTRWSVRPESGDGGGEPHLEAVAYGTDRAVAVGERGVIVFTDSVGEDDDRWPLVEEEGKRRDECSEGSNRDLMAVAFSGDGKTAVAVGDDGAIWVSTDGKVESWICRLSEVRDPLRAVALSHDGRIAIAAGKDGTVLVSTDRGASWNQPYSGTSEYLNAVAISDDDEIAIVVGQNGTVLRSQLPAFLPEVPKFSEVQAVFTKEADGRLPPKDKQSDSERQSDSILFQITFDTNFIRVGSVLILMFMTQYLITLTRYNLRLAAFYDARHDALRLTEKETLLRPRTMDELEQMMHVMSPDDLDFGRQPRSVMEYAMRMAKSISRGTRKVRKKTGKTNGQD